MALKSLKVIELVGLVPVPMVGMILAGDHWNKKSPYLFDVNVYICALVMHIDIKHTPLRDF